jgi:hypothetical protein
MTARSQRADTIPTPMDRQRLHYSAPAAASIVAVVAVAGRDVARAVDDRSDA